MAVSNQYHHSVTLSTHWVSRENLKQTLKGIGLSQNDQLIYSSHHYLPSREVFSLLEKQLTAK